MLHIRLPGLVCIFLFFLVIGVVSADETPDVLIYLQGGNSTIEEGSGGSEVITIQKLVPYVNIESDNTNKLVPVSLMNELQYPLDSSIVLVGQSGNTEALRVISNISLLDNNNRLTLNVIPLQYYDGTRLRNFVQEGNTTSLKGTYQTIGVYIEDKDTVPVNGKKRPHD
nr:hypothetical protein [uncultured Methanospirillum sp.]